MSIEDEALPASVMHVTRRDSPATYAQIRNRIHGRCGEIPDERELKQTLARLVNAGHLVPLHANPVRYRRA